MVLRSANAGDADYASRPSNLVDAPETYGDWRSYAFSNAPELADVFGVESRAREAAPSDGPPAQASPLTQSAARTNATGASF